MTFLLQVSLLTVFQLLLSEQTNTGEIKIDTTIYHELNLYNYTSLRFVANNNTNNRSLMMAENFTIIFIYLILYQREQ